MTDAPYWNDPASKDIALKLIADSIEAVKRMQATGHDADAVVDTLCGNLAYVLAISYEADDDEQLVETIAWAVRGKLRDARQNLPVVRLHMSKPGIA